MTAFKAKELTKQVQCVKQNHYIEKHERYVKKITDTKVRKAAKRGYSNITVTPSKRYDKDLLISKIVDFGYEVIDEGKNINIIW